MDIYDILVINLKIMRHEQGLSQLELSRKANLCDNYVNEIENRKKFVTLDTVAKLAKALNVPVYILLYEKYPELPDFDSLSETEFAQLIIYIASEFANKHK